MQNKSDTVTERTKEAEERIGDIGDKIMENNEAEKKRKGKLLDQRADLENLVIS